MNKSLLRMFLKGFIWEALGLVLIFALTGSLEVSLVYVSIRIVMYVGYHYLWKKIKWGKPNETTS